MNIENFTTMVFLPQDTYVWQGVLQIEDNKKVTAEISRETQQTHDGKVGLITKITITVNKNNVTSRNEMIVPTADQEIFKKNLLILVQYSYHGVQNSAMEILDTEKTN